MTARKYVEVSITELLDDLNQLTDDRLLSKSLLDEVVETYETEARERILVKDGIKTPEQFEKEKKGRNESRYHTRKLLKNMLAAGRVKPKNTSPHHIVAWNEPRAMRARAILSQVGIDVDDEVNGVFLPMYRKHLPHSDLPNAYAHLPVHTDMYYINITDLLRSETGDKEGVKAVLKDIAEELSEGTFPIHQRIS